MKKILGVLLCGSIVSAFGLSLLQNYQGDWESTVAYKVAPIKGTNQNSTPVVSYAGNTYVLNGTANATIGQSPVDQSSRWDAYTVESLPAALADGSIFVGNGSNVPAARVPSGAMTMSNTGVFSATASSFWTTPSAGNQNNVLTSVQQRWCSGVLPVLAAGAEATVTCTYGTAFTTAAYAVNITPLEPTTNNTYITTKVLSQSTTAISVRAHNASSGASQAGTIYGMAVGH